MLFYNTDNGGRADLLAVSNEIKPQFK